VVVDVSGDLNDEPDEMFSVNLTNPSGATIGDAQGVGTITDDGEGDDGAPPPPVSRSSGPSAAEIAAARLAAERRAHAAKVRAQRAKQLARAKRIAAQRAKEERIERQRAQEQLRKEDEAEARRAAGNPTETRAPRTPAAGFAGDGESSSKKTAPLVVIAFLLALVVLTLGLVPAYLVPWYRISMVLEEHRQQFTWVGGMAVLATGVLLLMVVIGG
jgi:hypothetical protein